MVLRYVEANPLRAGLVASAGAWPWSSVGRHPAGPPLAAGPVDLPGGWARTVDEPLTEAALAAMRRSVARGRPCPAIWPPCWA